MLVSGLAHLVTVCHTCNVARRLIEKTTLKTVQKTKPYFFTSHLPYMPAIPSAMIELGTNAPAFSLPDTISNHTLSLTKLTGKNATVIMFICNHCPYVKHINNQLIAVANDFIPKGVTFAAISSNDIKKYPEDGPDEMKRVATQLGYPFPYLYDESQQVAKAYHAACTPDFFVYNKNLTLAYRGQLDDSRPGNNITPNGKDLRAALQAIIEGKPVSPLQKPSIGCSLKWKD